VIDGLTLGLAWRDHAFTSHRPPLHQSLGISARMEFATIRRSCLKLRYRRNRLWTSHSVVYGACDALAAVVRTALTELRCSPFLNMLPGLRQRLYQEFSRRVRVRFLADLLSHKMFASKSGCLELEWDHRTAMAIPDVSRVAVDDTSGSIPGVAEKISRCKRCPGDVSAIVAISHRERPQMRRCEPSGSTRHTATASLKSQDSL